jgi:hypothetical protein
MMAVVVSAGVAAAAPVPQPWVRPGALDGLGRAAFVWRGDVWIWGSGLGRPRDLGPGTDPVWSSDGRYIAFLRGAAGQAQSLWLAAAQGGAARGLVASATSQTVAWVPGTDTLVAASVPTAYTAKGQPEGTAGMWTFDAVTGVRVRLEAGTFVNTLAAGAGEVAYSVTLAATMPVPSDALYAEALRGGQPRRLTVAAGNGIDVASVQAGRVQYWIDYDHSASVAADGLPLYSMPLQGGRPVALGTTLRYRAWLTPGPSDILYLIAGGPRIAWSDKSLRRCNLATGLCTAIYGGATGVANDPAAAPSRGGILFVASPSRGNNWGFASARAASAWAASRRLWLWRPGQAARAVPGAPAGSYQPAFTADARYAVVVASGGVWRVDLATGKSQEVVGGFLSETPDAVFGFYGYRKDIAASFAFAPV